MSGSLHPGFYLPQASRPSILPRITQLNSRFPRPRGPPLPSGAGPNAGPRIVGHFRGSPSPRLQHTRGAGLRMWSRENSVCPRGSTSFGLRHPYPGSSSGSGSSYSQATPLWFHASVAAASSHHAAAARNIQSTLTSATDSTFLASVDLNSTGNGDLEDRPVGGKSSATGGRKPTGLETGDC
ncbi:unnamed protein product [Protopolystoma xenopodis]|uniref:Uncharacterized protein n=1 Tax=Protopolystoma xenopodis TaxID=117903 RepID=A0A3S5CBM3_9PLAT|nr:unnamed protein product [Protopolystoma xenopodis]